MSDGCADGVQARKRNPASERAATYITKSFHPRPADSSESSSQRVRLHDTLVRIRLSHFAIVGCLCRTARLSSVAEARASAQEDEVAKRGGMELQERLKPGR